jgi:hypothetical protein
MRLDRLVQQPKQISRNVWKGVDAKIRQFAGILQAPETFSKLSHCFHTAEVAGSNPASPTGKYRILQVKMPKYDAGFGYSLIPCAATRRDPANLTRATTPSGVTSPRRCSPRVSMPSRFKYCLATLQSRYPRLRVGRARLGDTQLIHANTTTTKSKRYGLYNGAI